MLMKKQHLLSLNPINPVNRLKNFSLVFMTLLLSFLGYSGFAAVTVVPASGGTNICSTVATASHVLGAITITEGSTGDFNAGASSITLAPPPGWTFVVALPTVTAAPGNDVSIGVLSITSGTFSINFNASGVSRTDVITISNLSIQATTTSSAPGYIFAQSDFGVAGIVTGASGTNFGDQSILAAATPSVTIAASPSAAICTGTPITFTPTPVNGGTAPTYQWFVNGSFVGSGGFFSTSTLSNGNTVNCIMTPVGGTCISPSTPTSNTITVTVNPFPTAVTVTVGGPACGSATLVASNGGSGTIFFQGVTSGGTSTVLGGTPQVVSSTGTYFFRALAGGCWGTQGSASVTINSAPALFSVTGGGGYCAGGSGVAVGLSGSEGGVSYQLLRGGVPVGAPLAGTFGALDFGIQSTIGVYTVVATNLSTGCVATMTGSTTVSINPLPTTFNVTGGGAYCSGGAGSAIGLSGSSVGVSYQPVLLGSPSGAAVAGTGAAISFGNRTLSGTYTVIATNTTTGCTSTMTGSATVSITTGPTAFSVTGGGGFCTGGTGVVVGLGGSQNLTNYQLFRGASLISTLAGTGGVLNFGLQTVAGTYTVVATSSVTGCVSNMAGSAVVTVNPLPGLFTVTGGGSFCTGGAGVAVGLSGSAVGINYQLFLGGSPVGTPVAGTGSAISFGLQTATGSYTVVATDATTLCTRNMTGTAVISTTAVPTAFTVTGGGSYCTGGSGVSIGLTGSQVGVTYQLFNLATPVGTPVAGTGGLIFFGLQTAAGFYTVTATNTITGCTNNMTSGVAITILPLPTAHNVTGGGAYCVGGAGVTVGLDGSDVGVNYQLFLGVTPVGTPVAGTALALDFGLQTAAGIYTVVATDATTTCSGNMAGSATISINPLPTTFLVTGGGNFCAGGTGVSVGLSGSASGVSYQLFNGATALGTLAGTGGSLDFGLQTSAGTYTVVATDVATSCTNNMIGTATVVVDPTPPLHNVIGGGSYCATGVGVHVGTDGSDLGIDYQLFIDGVATGAPLSGTGGALDFGSMTAAGTYTIVATDIITGCTSNMTGSVSVIVNPLPTVFNVAGGGSLCAGAPGVDVTLSGSETGVNYQLMNGVVPTGAPLAGTGSSLNFGPQTTAGTYTVVATNTTTGCTENMSSSATVVVNPLPTAYTVTGGGTYCLGTSGLDLGLSNSDVGIIYQLYYGVTTVGTPLSGTGLALDFGFQTTTGTYTVIATDAATGCSATMSGSAVVNVSGPPVVGPIVGSLTVCQGGTITLLDTTAGGVWTSSNATVATISATGVVTGVSVGTVTFTYTVANSFGCDTFVTATRTVTGGPVVSPISGMSSVCQGLIIHLSDSTAGGSWSTSNSAVATVSPGGNVAGVSPGTVTISYTVTSPTTGCVTSAIFPMNVGNPMPTAALFPSGSAILCGNDPVTLYVLTSDSTSITYQWYQGGLPLAGEVNSWYYATTPGTYTASISNGTCEEMFSATTVLPQQVPVISYDTAAVRLMTDSFVTYQWFKNGVAIAGDTAQSMQPLGIAGDTFTVVVTTVGGCSDTSAPFVFPGVNKVQVVTIGEVKIYPNPATSILHIDAPVRVFVTIASPDGKILIDRKEAVSINVGQLSDGMYMIMVYDENNTLLKAEKFVKMQ